MKYSAERVVLVSLLLVLASGLAVHGALCVVADDASAKISEAGVALRRAFAAVLEAEGAGANVSGLVVELGLAGENLTFAQNAYGSGDFVEAVARADRCVVLASEVAGEASGLKSSALAGAKDAEWRLLAFSGVGVLVFLLVLVLAWAAFRRSYSRRLLGMRPEVGSDVEA